jgi:hypothetical protein
MLIAGTIVLIAVPIFTSGSTVVIAEVFNATKTTDFTDDRLSSAANGVDVSPSTGESLYLFEDSRVVADAGAELANGTNWSVAATASIDLDRAGATSVPRQVVGYDNDSVRLYYNDSKYIARYDNGSANATVSIPEPAPRNLSSLVVRWNGTELLLTNGTVSNTTTLTTSPDPAIPLWDWVGRVDEIRTYNGSINDSAVSGYTSDPISAYPDEPQGVRLMFDQLDNGETAQHFAGGAAVVEGGRLTGGVEPPSMVEGVDYTVDSGPFSITVLAGGYLEGQPTVYLEYAEQNQRAEIVIPIVIIGMLLSLLVVPAAKAREMLE